MFDPALLAVTVDGNDADGLGNGPDLSHGNPFAEAPGDAIAVVAPVGRSVVKRGRSRSKLGTLECLVAGVDEAGRGPLAGPVAVAAVILDPAHPIRGLNDSKQLTAERREVLYARITQRALAWTVELVSHEEIDRLNIYHATLAGMGRVLHALRPVPHLARVDGNRLPPELPCPGEAWIGGDARCRAIMAASIIAKVTRDRHMDVLHHAYPLYGFQQHKGYSTPEHLAALRRHGPCAVHRRTFAPVRALLEPELDFGPPLQA